MEHFEKQLTATIISTISNYFPIISFSCPLVNEVNMIFYADLNFTPDVFIVCIKVPGRGRGARDHEIWYNLLLTFSIF